MSSDCDPSLALHVFNDMFGGHVRKDVVIAAKYAPDELGKGCRAMITIYLYPETKEGRCGVVDLLHPSERNTPRCGNKDCRCMQ